MIENKESGAAGSVEKVWYTCRGCCRELEPSHFGVDRSQSSQRNRYCKECTTGFSADNRREKRFKGVHVCFPNNEGAGRAQFGLATRAKLDKIEQLGGVVWIETLKGMIRWHRDFRHPVYRDVGEWMQDLSTKGISFEYTQDLDELFPKKKRKL